VHVKKKRSTNITYKSSPRSRRRIPPATVNAPRTAGVPETGTFGVGTETIGDGVATTMTTCRVGIGVAVAGQTQEKTDGHCGFLQRLIPSMVAQTKPLVHPLSSPQDASHTPGAGGGVVGVGVVVGVEVTVGDGVPVGVDVTVEVIVGVTVWVTVGA